MTFARPRTRTAGSRESFSRARSAAAAASSAIAITRRVQLAARAVVGLPAPVVERRAARRMPIATSHWPVAPRAAERVGDRPRRATPSAARSARADASGSSGEQDERLGRRALDWSTPAFAHTKPWRVRQISRPRVGAHELGASRRGSTSTWRGSLPCSAASSRARAPRRRRRRARTIRPSALETTLCATTSTSRRRVELARRRARAARARSSPGRTSGRPGSGVAARSAAAAREPLEQRARARRAAAARRRARRAARRGRRACRRRARATARARPAPARRPPRASAAWRANEPGPNAGAITSGGVEQQRVRAGAVAVGHDHDAGARRREQRVDLAGVERRAVAGHEQRPARRRARPRAATPRSARRGLARLDRVVDDLRAGLARDPRGVGSAVTTITLVELAARAASASSTSATIAAASVRGGRRERAGEPLLGAAEAT